MPKSQYSIIILGGGCTALNFAMAYAKSKLTFDIVILEQRPKYVHDRNWSFWLYKDQEFDHRDILKQSWHSWSFSDHKTEIVHNSNNYIYTTIASDNFYEKAKSIIDNDSRITLVHNCTVTEISKNQQFDISTDQGTFKGDFIIDTRNLPYTSIKDYSDYYQIFSGLELQTEKSAFNASQVGLMDLLQDFDGGVSFIYTLPFSDKNALVEFTVFTSKFLLPESIDHYLQDYLKQNYSSHRYTTQHIEKSVLPMGLVKPRVPKFRDNYVHVGAGSGTLRESSGYGFLRLYNWSKNTVQDLENQRPPERFQNKRKLNVFLDRHFVKTMKQNPSHAKEICLSIAQNTDADSFAKFMTERHSFYDALKIIRSVPKFPFLKSLVQI